MGSFLTADDTPRSLFDCTEAEAPKEWRSINDGVMAGVSDGKFRITGNKTLEFYGTPTLENNGGFASLRSNARELGREKGNVPQIPLQVMAGITP